MCHAVPVTGSNGRAYGYDLGADLHRALRDPPPDDALDWVVAAVGADRVIEVRPLEGGRSSAVHLLTLQGRSGARLPVVLRRYVLDWVIDEPWAPGNEVRILRHLAETAVPAPRLLASDDGSATGTPATVMSVLPGRVIWHPGELEPWLWRLAEMLPMIHAVPVTADLSAWAPYEPATDLVPPPWSRHPRAWQRALEQYAGPTPPSDRVFLHRDYHPGNVLWSGGEVTGIVDWVGGCAGPPEEDVAHCRANLAGVAGMAAADRFLAIWQDLTGRPDYHPYFDLTAVVSMASETPDAAMDEFVASAAARLG